MVLPVGEKVDSEMSVRSEEDALLRAKFLIFVIAGRSNSFPILKQVSSNFQSSYPNALYLFLLTP